MANSTETILDNLTSKMTETLSRVQTSSLPITDSPMVPLSIKLDGSNYGLWSQIVEMYISGKDKLGYINGDYPQPPETDPSFRKWRIENAMVKGWLINSMDHSLVVNFICYPTAKRYDRLDHVRSDVLCLKPFPSIDRDAIGSEAMASGVVMAIKEVKFGHSQTLVKSGSSSQSKGHSDGDKCTHCGSTKHTRETYYKLHGYPDGGTNYKLERNEMLLNRRCPRVELWWSQ
ncbi:hypothetical protein AAG906_013105 [Vitis piasezkii]